MSVFLDDVYTTIPDPNNQIYTSESETYARIPAHPITVEAEVNPTPRNHENDELYEPAPHPPPPSVNSLKQVAGHSHSRQGNSLHSKILKPNLLFPQLHHRAQ